MTTSNHLLLNDLKVKSAAIPSTWSLLSTPPTASLSRGHRYPDVIVTASSRNRRIGCKVQLHNNCKLFISYTSIPGTNVLTIPNLSAVGEERNSSNVKLSDNLYIILNAILSVFPTGCLYSFTLLGDIIQEIPVGFFRFCHSSRYI